MTPFEGDLLPVPRRHDDPARIGGVFRRLPGVAEVAAQVLPYAAHWDDRNLAALASTEDGPWWCAMGDSAAEGVGATSPDRGWVGLLDTHLRADGRAHRLFNLSVSGARARDVTTTQIPRFAALCDRFGPPDLVTVAIGGNDIFQSVNVAAIQRHLTEVADALPEGSVLSRVAQARWSIVGMLVNRHIDHLVATRGLVVADVPRHYHAPFRQRVAADRFHPNDRGYTEIARAFVEAVDGP